jgi:glycosyltransferase involved in cell wall biosynthesis
MKSILHISYDYGNPENTDKTTAVINLVNQTRRITRAVVLDLSRTVSFRSEFTKVVNKDHIKINSFGLPMGLTHRFQLERVNRKIRNIGREGMIDFNNIELVHAHKLTFDGYVGYLVSEAIGVPLFVTLRQTDFWVLKSRPDLRRYYKRTVIKAEKIFYLVPIMLPLLRQRFGDRFYKEHIEKKLVFLPNIIDINAKPAHHSEPDAPLVTILRMTRHSVQRKNLKKLLKALGELKDYDFKLKIVGDGDYLPTVKSWVVKFGLNDKVFFTGHIPNEEINEHYADAKAFVMPSFSESFGLVYAESLLNGTPILYSKGVIGFHGVFKNVGSGVNPFSTDSIKKGIIDILQKNEFYRDEIKQLHQNGAFSIFSSEYAYKTYKQAYDEVLKSGISESRLQAG